MPGGGAIRQAILHHQPDGQRDDAMGVMAFRCRQVVHRGVEIAVTAAAVMLGIPNDQVSGAAGVRVSHIMERSPHSSQTRGSMPALRARTALVMAVFVYSDRCRQILFPCDSLRRVGHISSWANHDRILPKHACFQRTSVNPPEIQQNATVMLAQSQFFPCRSTPASV